MVKTQKYNKNCDSELKLNDVSFQKIIKFYLFECPVPGKSSRGSNFKDLGWVGSSKFSKLKKKMLGAATESLRKNYHPCSKDDLKKNFEVANDIEPENEYCIFFKNDSKTVMQSLFSAIRNSFAHGSFSKRKYGKHNIYYMKNYHNNYLKAEIVLHEETLLNWIKIVQTGLK